MQIEYLTVTLNLLGALVSGGLIGLERSYHGRPAGFRTHTLVCLTSSLLMLYTVFQWSLLPGIPFETVRTDPTRMAQGIMTGIGFLGAGVIYKEGLSVRGLTTAGSIWITAAIGILFGVGFFFPAILSTILTLGILSAFRWIEHRMPSQSYAHFHIRYEREQVVPEEKLRALLYQFGFSIANMSYRMVNDGRSFEYRMVIRTENPANTAKLAETLCQVNGVSEFRISPTGD
jgi:putative Mg2+ transporter-C (MgtC) family protein